MLCSKRSSVYHLWTQLRFRDQKLAGCWFNNRCYDQLTSCSSRAQQHASTCSDMSLVHRKTLLDIKCSDSPVCVRQNERSISLWQLGCTHGFIRRPSEHCVFRLTGHTGWDSRGLLVFLCCIRAAELKSCCVTGFLRALHKPSAAAFELIDLDIFYVLHCESPAAHQSTQELTSHTCSCTKWDNHTALGRAELNPSLVI